MVASIMVGSYHVITALTKLSRLPLNSASILDKGCLSASRPRYHAVFLGGGEPIFYNDDGNETLVVRVPELKRPNKICQCEQGYAFANSHGIHIIMATLKGQFQSVLQTQQVHMGISKLRFDFLHVTVTVVKMFLGQVSCQRGDCLQITVFAHKWQFATEYTRFVLNHVTRSGNKARQKPRVLTNWASSTASCCSIISLRILWRKSVTSLRTLYTSRAWPWSRIRAVLCPRSGVMRTPACRQRCCIDRICCCKRSKVRTRTWMT